MREWIIDRMTDTDYYKLTMMQAVFEKYPNVDVEYDFKLRNYPPAMLLPYMNEIREEITHLGDLYFTSGEIDYLRKQGVFKENFLRFLRTWKYRPADVVIKNEGGEFDLKINGSWLNTILFEVPVLAIISEVYFKNRPEHQALETEAYKRLDNKIKFVANKGIQFADFGTRRRFSGNFHLNAVKRLCQIDPLGSAHFVGTSNVMLADMCSVKPIGTMAHEWIMAHQALAPLRVSQKAAFQAWADVYRGRLGIALSDTLGFEAFLSDFDMYFSKLYDGARQDSGDPISWCNSLLKHYRKMGINTTTKTAVFSDGLDFEKAWQINDLYSNQIGIMFGIGTYLTNDTGYKPLQIVIKMTKCNGQPVAKISDSPGKQMCRDNEYLANLKRTFGISGGVN